MEKILPDSIAKLERCLPSTPKQDVSMTDNFTVEHSQILTNPVERVPAVSRRNSSLLSRPDMESSVFSLSSSQFLTPSSSMTLPPKHEDLASPSAPSNLTNWAHLSLISAQRNTLSTSLKATEVAHTEARASVAALRRLAFRLAVNISVKEKRIVTSARSLAASRKNEYVLGTGLKGAERRVQELEKEWREERARNREILASLERASALTLQYSDPNPARQPVSPPASPPTRVASISQHGTPPRTPTHSPKSSKVWDALNPNAAHHHRHPSTPETIEIRTPNDRLIKAKRESDHALLVARSRIEALQADCFRSKEIAKQLELNRIGLEDEIDGYKARVSALESSKAAVEATLRTTEGRVDDALRLEKEVRGELDGKTQEIQMLKQKSRSSEASLKALGESNRLLQEEVECCTEQIGQLERARREMEEEVERLERRIEHTEHGEAELAARLAASESEKGALQAQLDKSAANVVTLEKAATFFDEQVRDYNARITSLEGSVSWLDDGLKTARGLKDRVESELEIMRSTVTQHESTILAADKANSGLREELKTVREAKSKLESEMEFMRERLAAESDARAELHDEVRSLQYLKGNIEDELRAARIRIEELDRPEILAELEALRASKVYLDQRLASIQKSASNLQEEVRATQEKLETMEASKKNLIVKLQQSEARREDLESKLLLSETANSSLSHELEHIRHSKADTEERLLGLQSSLEAKLRESETTNSSLQDEVQSIRVSKAESEELLRNVLRAKASLESKLRDSETKNTSLHHDVESIRISEKETREQLNGFLKSQASIEDRLSQSETSKAESEELLRNVLKTKASLESKLRESETRNTSLHHEVESIRISENETREQLDGVLKSQASIEDRLLQSETSKADSDELLRKVLKTKASLESSLRESERTNTSLQHEVESIRDSETETKKQLHDILKSQASIENKLSQSETSNASLHHELQTVRHSAEQAQLHLQSILESKASLEARFFQAETTNKSLQQEVERIRRSAEDMEHQLNSALESKAVLTSKLHEAKTNNTSLQQEVQQIRDDIRKTEEQLSSALESKGTLESGLLAVESNSARLSARLSVADLELGTLRATNATLEASERRLSSRLYVAENELDAVRRANQELEEFLDQAENDMLVAEAFTVDCQNRLDVFVDEGNARLAMAERSRGKYKRRLATSKKELDILKDENETLSSQLEQKSHEIEEVRREEEEMREQLAEKDRTIEAMQQSKVEFKASMEAIESELKELKESKETFEKLVRTLKQKTKTLDILNEWHEPPSDDEGDAFNLGPHGFEFDLASREKDIEAKGPTAADHEKRSHGAEKPRPMSSKHRSAHSKRSLENANQRFEAEKKHRPVSQCTDGTAEPELDAWAKEVERVRMLRDETAVQLKGMKKLKANLRKSLKRSESELDQLAKAKRKKEKAANRPASSHLGFPRTIQPSRSKSGVGFFDREIKETTPRPHTSLGLEGASPLRPSTARSKHSWSGGFHRHSSHMSPNKPTDGSMDLHDKEVKKGWRGALREAFGSGSGSVGRKRSPLVRNTTA